MTEVSLPHDIASGDLPINDSANFIKQRSSLSGVQYSEKGRDQT
jgi:hypothetical protein